MYEEGTMFSTAKYENNTGRKLFVLMLCPIMTSLCACGSENGSGSGDVSSDAQIGYRQT